MQFSLSAFTEWVCAMQAQKPFGYQTLFKLLEQSYGIRQFLLVENRDGPSSLEHKTHRQPFPFACRNLDYDLVKAFFSEHPDPFCRAMPPKALLEKDMVTLEEAPPGDPAAQAAYRQFLKRAGASQELCLYLQEDGRYLAALSIFPERPLSDSEREIFKSTGRCIAQQYVLEKRQRTEQQKCFHEFFDGVHIGVAVLDQEMKILDQNRTFSDFCEIIVHNGSFDTDTGNGAPFCAKEKNYAQCVIDHLGANLILKPERIKIDCLLYNYRVYVKPIAFREMFGGLRTAMCVYLTEYRKIRDQWVLATLNTLTPREREILTMMAYGYDNREIEQRCFISPNTIKTHQRNIYQKFNVANKTELISKLYLMSYRHK